MASNTSMIHVRVENETKEQAMAALSAMGLSMSEAIRLFMHQIAVSQTFPLTLKVPNKKTHTAMAEAEEIAKVRGERFLTSDKLFNDLSKDYNL